MGAPDNTAADRNSETRIMALAGIAARVFNAGIVFLTQVLFARVMGVSEFGVYSTANTIMLLVAGFATLGLVAMPQRFWPEYENAEDQARLRGLARFASWAPFAIGSGFALGGTLIVVLARDLLSPPVATAACIALLTIPALTSLDVVEGIALTKAWKGLAYGIAFVLRPLIVPFVFGGAWLFGVKPNATLAMASLVAATWLASLVLLVLVHRKLRHLLPKGPVAEERQRWIRAGLPIMLIDGAFMLMTSTDILLMTVYHSDAAVGIYSAAARLVALVAFVHHGLTWASAHHFSHLYQSGDMDGLATYAAKTTLWTFLPSVGAALVMALIAPLLLMLFGKGFQDGGVITAVLMLGLLTRAAVGPAEQLLVMTDNQNACAYAYGWAFVVNLGFCLALVPLYGGLGAAASTAFAYLAASIIVAREVRLRLGFDVHIFALLRRKQEIALHA
ncbi:MAG: lipopolysaccharide biosynthesis protein [Beijerinckiaceae bacterium]